MNEHLVAIKAALTGAITALTAFLGWRGLLLTVWILAMTLDYLSGSAAAIKNGEWESRKGKDGIWHKIGIIIVVIGVAAADFVLVSAVPMLASGFHYPGLLFPLVLAWYTLTELGSVLENAVALGAAVPAWVVKALKVGLDAIDKTVDKEDK